MPLVLAQTTAVVGSRRVTDVDHRSHHHSSHASHQVTRMRARVDWLASLRGAKRTQPASHDARVARPRIVAQPYLSQRAAVSQPLRPSDNHGHDADAAPRALRFHRRHWSPSWMRSLLVARMRKRLSFTRRRGCMTALPAPIRRLSLSQASLPPSRPKCVSHRPRRDCFVCCIIGHPALIRNRAPGRSLPLL